MAPPLDAGRDNEILTLPPDKDVYKVSMIVMLMGVLGVANELLVYASG